MDKTFNISGIQQIGIGTVDFRKSWNWYIEMFGTDIKILEDNTVAERMLPYTGGQAQKRHACIAVNLQGGGGFEIWQYSERQPQPADFEIAIGDLGTFAAKLNCRDVEAFHKEISVKVTNTPNSKGTAESGAKPTVVSELSISPDGKPCFYVKDLYGNLFQIVEQKKVFIDDHRLTGGIAGAMVGVSDIDKSLKFYSEVLGYDNVIYDTYGQFADWAAEKDGEQTYRRVLLGTSKPRTGAFSGLLGDSTIELVQALERTPRKIYEGRYWGDPGFIQICFDISGMKVLEQHCTEKGFPFTVDSCPGDEQFDMGEASGHFTYIEDPDGTLIEFVETHKIPVAAKLGWYLDLKKRNVHKQLPKFLFKMMGLVSREKINI